MLALWTKVRMMVRGVRSFLKSPDNTMLCASPGGIAVSHFTRALTRPKHLSLGRDLWGRAEHGRFGT